MHGFTQWFFGGGWASIIFLVIAVGLSIGWPRRVAVDPGPHPIWDDESDDYTEWSRHRMMEEVDALYGALDEAIEAVWEYGGEAGRSWVRDTYPTDYERLNGNASAQKG